MKIRFISLFLSLSAFVLWADTPVVGIYAGAGADPYLQAAAGRMFRWMGYETVKVTPDEINRGNFGNIAILYFPGGSTGPMRRDITETGREKLRAFIRSGRGYIGTCAGALMACRKNLWLGHDDNYGLFDLVPVTGIGPIPELDDGDGICMAELSLDPACGIDDWAASGVDPSVPAYVLSINSPWFDTRGSSGVIVVAEYAAIGKPACIACRYGKGRVFLTGPHPEFEEDGNRDGNSYFDDHDDRGSDWPLMRMAAAWCLMYNEP